MVCQARLAASCWSWISQGLCSKYLIFNILYFLFAVLELLLGALEERGVADWVKDFQDIKGTQR